jgi:hypothetical protein
MSSTLGPWLPKKDPWHPADYDDVVVYAVRAFASGKATEHQQKIVWRWMRYVTGTSDEFSDLSFRPGDEGRRATDFAEGKKFVGLQFGKMLNDAVTPKKPADAEEARPARKTSTKRKTKNAS